MNGKSNAENKTDLALTGVSILATLLGNLPVSAVTTFARYINDRRTKKRLDRLEKLLLSFGRRLTKLECKFLESPDIDLLDEIIAKAVSDEDEDKTELYAAMVQYWLEHKSEIVPYEVRLLGNAIRELTVEEMEAFHGVVTSKDEYPIKTMPKQLQEVFWNRVSALGLHGGISVSFGDHRIISQIGRKLVEIYRLSIATAPK